MSPSKRVLIAAGGTGGHVFPALAVAHVLQARGFDIQWIGTCERIEASLVPQAGIPIAFIPVSALRGQRWFQRLLAPLMLLNSALATWRILHRLKPDVVLGMGGFAAGPCCALAWLRRTPVVIHEQNAIPGMTNRYLSRVATQVLEAFEGTFSAAPNVAYVGNPVRDALFALPAPRERFLRKQAPASESSSAGTAKSHSPIDILVVGGSLGAKALNTQLPKALARFSSAVRVLHQTGQGKLAATQVEYADLAVDVTLVEFIDEVTDAYAKADLVICRAGATTCAELAAVGVGSILVPYPYAVDDHQTVNASALVDAGAAILLPESRLSEASLCAALQPLLAEPDALRRMAEAAKALAQPEAATRVADFVQELSS